MLNLGSSGCNVCLKKLLPSVWFVRIGQFYLKPKQYGQEICIGQDT